MLVRPETIIDLYIPVNHRSIHMGDLTIQESSSIDELYNRIKDHDLVLTVDAPLADALNARLQEPHIGPFATTPRRLAMNNIPAQKKFTDKKELFVEITEETSLDWKLASYLFENIVDCWKETGTPDKILKHERYDTEASKKIVNILKNTVNRYSAEERYTVPNEKDLAVIAPHQFTELDKKVLPEDYDVILPFKNSKTSLPKFNVFNSTTEIVQTVQKHVVDSDPKDVAVVMKKDSEYRYLVEALFRSNQIPYMVSKDITEDHATRKFLNLIRFSFFKSGVRLKDIRSLTDETIDPEEEEYFLRSSDKQIKQLMDEIPNMTFKELIDQFEDLEELKDQLEDLDLLDKKITLQRLNSLTYFLETFDITTKTAGQGVLIASPSTSTYIDRPIVLYLGLDSSWTPEPPETPWIDEKQFDKDKIKDFKILLQNGEKRYYLVKDREMNQTITPSFYFNEFTKEPVGSFTDLEHELNHTPLKDKKKAFEKEEVETEHEETKSMSQSTLNTFAYCPKDHFFDKLTEGPDKVYFRRGTLFHDLAEFLMNYPDTDEDEKIIQKMTEELSPFLEEHQLPTIKTRFKIGMQNIQDFLKDREPMLEDPEGYEKTQTDNIFADLFDKPIETRFTEVSFYNESIGAKGKVDLVLNQDRIVDHKTGNKKTISKLMRKSNTEDIDERPDFQAKMYIAHHRHHYPNTSINFTFFHLLNNERDVVSGTPDPSDNIVNIVYHPREFNDLVHEEKMFEWLKSSKNRKKVLNKLGYDDYLSFFEDRTVPDMEKDELLEHPITAEFTRYCQDKIGSYKYVKKACKSIMKKFVKFRMTNYFKSDIDEFENFLKEQIELYDGYKSTNFPLKDADPDEIDNKDMVIIDG